MQPQAHVAVPPAADVCWLAETEVEGESRCALVWAQHAHTAKGAGARVLEQPLHELVKVRQVQFKGFSRRES